MKFLRLQVVESLETIGDERPVAFIAHLDRDEGNPRDLVSFEVSGNSATTLARLAPGIPFPPYYLGMIREEMALGGEQIC